MQGWMIQALLSAMFAGLVAVSAKAGLSKVSGDLALTIRTAVIMLLVGVNTVVGKHYLEASRLSKSDWFFLVFSGTATMLSWLFYYRAVKIGPVSGVALIDKSSVLMTVLLSVLILGEALTWRTVAGATLMFSGLLVLTWK